MAGRLGIDFGTSNTVIAQWDALAQEGKPLLIPEYGYFYTQGGEQVAIIPSLIHYQPDGRRWIGHQVLQQNLLHAPGTFRWMKRYIAQRSPYRVRVGERDLTPFDAAQDFLSAVLLFAAQEAGQEGEEVALSVPVEAFEHYEDWLTQIAQQAGMPRFRLIDEPSAAALGYGASIRPGDVYLIFDFGGGTVHAAVVLIEESERLENGRRCRVLGKAGADLGGAVIDQWLFMDVLKQNQRSEADEVVRRVSNLLLVECERAKIQLSSQEKASISVVDPQTGAALGASYTRAQFEALLEEHGGFTTLERTLRRALNEAYEHGYDEERIKAVLMVGGSSQIPAVQRLLQRSFGRERVMLNRPLDAIARGAAAFVAGTDFYDHIQHSYAIRYLNREKQDYDYWTIVERGTPYPVENVARLTVKASYDGQKQLGVAIFEVSETRKSAAGAFELVFDPSGAARLTPITAEAEYRRQYFWMNEAQPTFLLADPPAQQGEKRFEIVFSIDANKRLLLTARDLHSGKLVYKDYPVVKLT